MSSIHSKVTATTPLATSVSSATSASLATTSSSIATISPMSVTAGTMTVSGVGTITSVASGLTSRVTTLENSYGNAIIRLDPKQTDEQAFRLPWGKVASVSHEELIKYIGERDLRESNELVRTLWDRYQTAVKLIWSEEDEQEK